MGESDRFPRHPLSYQPGSNLQRKKETSWDSKEKAPKLNQSWKKKMVGRKRARPAHQRLCQWSDQRSVQIWQPLKPPICHLFLVIFFGNIKNSSENISTQLFSVWSNMFTSSIFRSTPHFGIFDCLPSPTFIFSGRWQSRSWRSCLNTVISPADNGNRTGPPHF